jgi:hypothetical protein
MTMGTENQINEPGAKKAYCCFICDEGQTLLKQPGLSPGDERMIVARHGCRKDAEWEIYGSNGYEDVAHACTEHVGPLLSDGGRHEVYPVPGYGTPVSGVTIKSCDPDGERRCAACFPGVGPCTAGS